MTWCSDCREDVLLVASPQDRFVDTCIQCRRIIHIHRPEQPVGPPLGSASHWTRPVELRGSLAGVPLALSEQSNTSRQDSAHWVRPSEDEPHAHKYPGVIDTTAGCHSTILVWCALMVGLAALTFGGVLTGWSMINDQSELLRIGVPASIGGLVSFLTGLALQADMNGHSLRRIGHVATRNILETGQQTHPQRLDLLTGNTETDPANAMLDLKRRLNEFGSEIRHSR